MNTDIQLWIFKLLGFAAQLIGILSIAMVVLTLWSLYVSLKQERPVLVKRLVRSMVLSAASLAVLIYFSKLSVELSNWLIWGGAGLAVGAYWSQTVRMTRREDGIYSKNTLLYLVVWAGTFALSQLFVSLRNNYVNSAILFAIFSAGIVMGMNGMLLRALLSVRPKSKK